MIHLFARELDMETGPITIAATDQGIVRAAYSDIASWKQSLRYEKYEVLEESHPYLTQAEQELQEYFRGTRRSFETPLPLKGTTFQKLVWNQLQLIPYGELRSYKEIAAAMGVPKAVRAVGGANNKNPVPILVPCHRVVGANGSLVGYAGGLDIKERLIRLEAEHVSSVSM
ncbi:methylated-DNA--[protein]-cysteine S-methyltransferase [Alkalicoccus chagannorensis]|uniref:methylated-DNA--[protein]-cysteine S-methyltransferase n=1 Tax=Alkalicoccus chagannorensis TaxID=427072 RepID=UPI00040E1E27|nr:methylated-DNA--[protein]-cysteine S-methyltransferase [Alkalicoccus chagannorensis]